jgi:hypothetical protein
LSPAGWSSDLPAFERTPSLAIREALQRFVRDASQEQIRAWDDTIPRLQTEARELLATEAAAAGWDAILEYKLFYEERRADAVVLGNGAVAVIELKGKQSPSPADLDQAAAYARDLRAYHALCHERPVTAILVPTRAGFVAREENGVWVVGPEGLDELLRRISRGATGPGLTRTEFLDEAHYSPLPTLVEAARDLFHSGTVREIWRARAHTDPAVDAIARIAHDAAHTRTRHLVLITGVPGAGKTLVGMRAVHAHYLDDLAVRRKGRKPTAAGLYLTGNGPLAEVLQYELRKSGGGGKTFVRHIKSYLDSYGGRPDRIPPEHLLVFDEAQRAFDADRVADVHNDWPVERVAAEPELFLRLCERMPEWSVIVGLIGGGQEIHIGEERGLIQWRDALERAPAGEQWIVHGPADLEPLLGGRRMEFCWNPALHLDTEIRFHLAHDLHSFIARTLEGEVAAASRLGEALWRPHGRAEDGLRLWITRDFESARLYFRERFGAEPGRRFGLLASSKDKLLPKYGVDNSFQTTRRLRRGPWFTNGDEDLNSCRHLRTVATEFDSQGLELDMALLCWGGDLVRETGAWTNRHASKYAPRGRTRPVDPLQMRMNAYRVLLTRGREGTIVFVPPDRLLDETWDHLLACGFRELKR